MAQLVQLAQVVPQVALAAAATLMMKALPEPVALAELEQALDLAAVELAVRIRLETQIVVVLSEPRVSLAQPLPMPVRAAAAAVARAVVKKGVQVEQAETEVASMVAQPNCLVAAAALVRTPEEPVVPVLEVSVDHQVVQEQQALRERIPVVFGFRVASLEPVEMAAEPKVAAAAVAAVDNIVHSVTTELATELAVAVVAAKVAPEEPVVAEEVHPTAFIFVQMVQTAQLTIPES